MNMRHVTLSLALAAAGSCFAASQLKANEPAQPDAVTQDVTEPVHDECGLDQTDPEAWMTCAEWMLYEESIAIDEVIEPIVAEQAVSQEVAVTLADQRDDSLGADGAVASEEPSLAEETATDELLESEEVAGDDAEQADIDDVQIGEEAAVAGSESTEEGVVDVVADEDFTEDYQCVEGFDGWIVENDFEADGLSAEESTTVTPVDLLETDDDGEAIESRTREEAVDRLETEEVAIAEVTEEIASEEDSAPVAESGSDEPIDVEAPAGETAEEPCRQQIVAEITGEEPVDAAEAIAVEGETEALETVTAEVNRDDATDIVEVAETADAKASVTIPTDDGEVEGGVDGVESVIEEVTPKDVADQVEAEVTEEAEAAKDLPANAAATKVESGREEIDEGELATEEPIEEETAIDATAQATGDAASPVAVETIDEDSVEQQAVEEVQEAVDVCEDLTTIDVVNDEETLEVAEPLVEESELQDTGTESVAGDEANEPEAGSVRTFELGGCKITVQSERQLDDFELLDMLWETIYQVEAEMD